MAKKTNKDWYRISALADRRAEIHIYEQIGEDFWTGEGMTAKKFLSELKGLDVDSIDLHINSPGGSVFDGQAIYSMLKAHKARVNVHIDGIAASIASVIAMAGDSVTMPENALMMVHDPSGVTMGTAEDHRKTAESLDKVKAGIIAAYRGKTGLDEEVIAGLMSEETWMSAAEAVDYGFADRVAEPVNMQASASFGMLNKFKNLPRGLIAGVIPAAHQSTAKEVQSMADTTKAPEITLELIRAEHPAVYQAIAAEAAEAARKEGAEAERLRIKAVREQCIPGHEALVESLMYDGATTGPEAAVKVLQAKKALLSNTLAAMHQDAPPALPASAAPEGEPGANAPIEVRAQSKWDKDPGIQAEFNNNFKSYLAWFKAEAARKEA